MARRFLTVAALVAALAAFDCGKAEDKDGGQPLVGADAGPDAGGDFDGSLPDGGAPDAGLPDIVLPTAEGWTFYGTANGGPRTVFGVSADRGGNIWVAGGEEGLFLLRPGADRFRRFTTDDGLRPYGYPTAEQGVIDRVFLKVIAVAGGPANTVFVGYEGLEEPPGEYGCEDNWDGPSPDPDIYKSGDADKVVLSGDSIRVVHYDISSGQGVVGGEPRGREKLCSVYRIVYDAGSASLWFGGNHAYAWGDPGYAGDPTCYGQLGCSGVMEHAHALLNGYAKEDSTGVAALTDDYRGVALDPSGELWVGGLFRSQHCPGGSRGSGFWGCESGGISPANQIDWWTDEVAEYSRPSQRVDDYVSSMAAAADGSIWIGSFYNGLAHRLPGGGVDFITTGLVDPLHVYSVAVDPLDGSVWVGAGSGGLTRVQGGSFVPYGSGVFGRALVSGRVSDIQVDGTGAGRRILVGFQAGAIGVYTGD